MQEAQRGLIARGAVVTGSIYLGDHVLIYGLNQTYLETKHRTLTNTLDRRLHKCFD